MRERVETALSLYEVDIVVGELSPDARAALARVVAGTTFQPVLLKALKP